MANLLDAIRTRSPEEAVASLYETVEVRTNFTPPLRMSTKDILLLDPADPRSRPPWWLKYAKPTVVLSGNGPRVTIAPEGVAGDGTVPMLLAIGAVVGIGFVLGRWSKR